MYSLLSNSQGIDEKSLIPLASNLKIQNYIYGDYLLKEGQCPPGMFLILDGQCVVRKLI